MTGKPIDEFTALLGSTGTDWGRQAEEMVVDAAHVGAVFRAIDAGTEVPTREQVRAAGVCVSEDGKFTTTRPIEANGD